MGYKDIVIISWNSVVADKNLNMIREKNELLTIQQELQKNLNKSPESFVNKVLGSINANNYIQNSIFLKRLNFTKILLFKPLVVEDGIEILIPEHK